METKNYFLSLLSGNVPDAVAVLKGSPMYPDINGLVKFYALPESGVLIAVEVSDLPDGVNEDAPAFFAFHLHETGDCSGDFGKTGITIIRTMYRIRNMPVISRRSFPMTAMRGWCSTTAFSPCR